MKRGAQLKAFLLTGALGGAVAIIAGIISSRDLFPLTAGELGTSSCNQTIHTLGILIATIMVSNRWAGANRTVVIKALPLGGLLLISALLFLMWHGPRWLVAALLIPKHYL